MAGSRMSEEPWAPCIAIDIDTPDETLSGGAGAPYYPDRRWKNKKELKVEFLNPIPTWRLTNPQRNFLSTSHIIRWANVWSSKKFGLAGRVPKFTAWHEGNKGESDIRVKFARKHSSMSLIGTEAQSHQGEASMILNLTKEDDSYRQYTVIHEFGHALGLGHEHQMSQLAEAIDEPATIRLLMKWGMTADQAREKFKRDFTLCSEASDHGVRDITEFDPQSIMCYPIPEECIKESHRSSFTPEQFKMITTQSYNKRKSLSEIDKETIKKLYPGHSESSTRCVTNRVSKPQSSRPVRQRSQNRRKQPYQKNTRPHRTLRQQQSTLPPINLTVAQQAIARDPSQHFNLTVDRTSFPANSKTRPQYSHLQQQLDERGYKYATADGRSIIHVKPKLGTQYTGE